VPIDPARPDLAIVLTLDRDAPRAARHHVRQVDRPSPDLRDLVVLLSSELVTQAVERATGGTVELRVWMPSDVVRVEVRGQAAAIVRSPGELGRYSPELLDRIADRWSAEADGTLAAVWFEIDRHRAPERPAPPGPFPPASVARPRSPVGR
jgi:hypothetical protein